MVKAGRKKKKTLQFFCLIRLFQVKEKMLLLESMFKPVWRLRESH